MGRDERIELTTEPRNCVATYRPGAPRSNEARSNEARSNEAPITEASSTSHHKALLGIMTHQIYLVEDHPVMRQGYATVIGQQVDLSICGEADSADEALRDVLSAEPDLVVLDLSLKGGSGLELIKDLQAQAPELPILVVSMHDESLYAERALRAGARGYLMKSEADTLVVKALREILGGGVYLSESMNAQLLMRFAGRASPAEGSSIGTLSDRELEVFEYMGRGLTTREIAEELVLSPKTIDSYRSRVKEKLNIDTNAQLRRRATMWVEHQDTGVQGA